jgi:LPS-assembly lipoprotein
LERPAVKPEGLGARAETGRDRRAVLALLAAAPLAACGFHPLYGRPTAAADGAVAARLAAIRINDVVALVITAGAENEDRRLGQVLRNELTNRLTAGVGPQPQLYDLLIELRQSTSALQIQTSDTVTRYNMVLTADFKLYQTVSRDLLYSGSADSIGSYDVVESEYATLVAEQETARDAARELATTITSILALYFERSTG